MYKKINNHILAKKAKDHFEMINIIKNKKKRPILRGYGTPNRKTACRVLQPPSQDLTSLQ